MHRLGGWAATCFIIKPKKEKEEEIFWGVQGRGDMSGGRTRQIKMKAEKKKNGSGNNEHLF